MARHDIINLTINKPTPPPCGYTLVEMLVVLGVLAMMVGLAWPSLRSPWGRTRLEDAGAQLRVALARTRVKAIESGTAWAFRFEPGTGRFQAAPLAPRGDDPPSQADSPADDESPADETIEGELPHDVRFVDLDAIDAADAVDEALASRADADSGTSSTMALSSLDESDEEWAGRILFYPNGRSTPAKMVLVGADRRAVEVTLRGLTGMARVGKPWRVESAEVEPSSLPSEPAAQPESPP